MMAERPLLALPSSQASSGPPGGGGAARLRLPTDVQQISTYGPVFRRLRETLARPGGVMTLRDDPESLTPDRVIVFEIAGRIDTFRDAVARVPGLELLAAIETDFPADAHFAVVDKRDQDRPDKPVTGRFYLAMPNLNAFSQLL